MPLNHPDIPAVDPSGTEAGVLPTEPITAADVLGDIAVEDIADPVVRANVEAFVAMHNSTVGTAQFLSDVQVWLAAEQRQEDQ